MTLSLTDRFTVFDNSATSPVVLHAPHGSRFIPDDLLSSYLVDATELGRERDLMTDHVTDELVESAVRSSGASAIVNRLSRFVVDVERFPDEREEMLAVGIGAFYTHGSQGQRIRPDSVMADPALREFFDAYSLAVTELVQRTMDAHGRAIIVDVHSYPTSPLPYEVHADEPRPQLDVGADDTHTPPNLLAAVRDAFGHLSIGVNESFHGTYVPLRFYDAGDTRVQSVMLEIRRDVFMDEVELKRDEGAFALVHSALLALLGRYGNTK
ncbi:MAG: N-formylglutamate amidohydrolase [Microbacteriaceae bacterium]|nr:N-formylglutamate amidohydrolase [Microbacteriaceae bacterium]